jgi:hypothetical protein
MFDLFAMSDTAAIRNYCVDESFEIHATADRPALPKILWSQEASSSWLLPCPGARTKKDKRTNEGRAANPISKAGSGSLPTDCKLIPGLTRL